MELVLAAVVVVCYSLAGQTLAFPIDTTAQSVDCIALANDGDCDFYTECVEARFQCGSDGYPLGYGDRYCRRFGDNIDCFTDPNGKDWVNDARICHMKTILNSDLYNSNTTTCSELQEYAFESHSSCYVDSGFCTTDVLLSDTNLQCLQQVFDTSDSFSRLAIQKVYDTAASCPKPVVNSFLFSVRNRILNAATSTYRQLLETLEELLGGCNSAGLDVVFVMDGSGSIGNTHFDAMKNFVFNTIFEIRYETHVGVIQFSRDADIVIPLDSLNNNNRFQNEGCTNTFKALELLNTAFETARTSEGIPRVAIVITDGRSCDKTLTAQAAQAIHDSGITVYSFGIGDTDDDELNAIASEPSNVFHISSFSSDEFDSQLIPLRTKTCTTPAIASVNQPLQGTITRRTRRLLKYDFPDEGLTLKLEGRLQVYGSFTVPNPTSLTADFSVESDNEGIDYFVSPAPFTNNDSDGSDDRQSNSVYLSIVGLEDRVDFVLETSLGDTTSTIAMAEN